VRVIGAAVRRRSSTMLDAQHKRPNRSRRWIASVFGFRPFPGPLSGLAGSHSSSASVEREPRRRHRRSREAIGVPRSVCLVSNGYLAAAPDFELPFAVTAGKYLAVEPDVPCIGLFTALQTCSFR